MKNNPLFFLIMAIIFSGLTFSQAVHASDIPDWMAGDRKVMENSDAQKRTWLVVAGSEEHPLEGLRIIHKQILVPYGDSYKNIYDLGFAINQGDEVVSYDRSDVAYLNYYSRFVYEVYGAPVSFKYGIEFTLKDDQRFHNEVKMNFPNVLRPDLFYYRKAMYGTDSMQEGQYRVEKFQGHVIALSWSKKMAERVRDNIILNVAGKEVNRAFVEWKKTAKVYTANGVINVMPDYNYNVSFPFTPSYKSWVENTEGTFSLMVNGVSYRHQFSNRCIGNLQKTHQQSNSCLSQPRIDLWRAENIGLFTRAYFDNSGAYLFYGTGSNPRNADDVDMSLVKVEFNLEVK